MATDPVCGMEVDENETDQTYEYEGTTYYFCPRACKLKFKQNPDKYLENDGDHHQNWTFHD